MSDKYESVEDFIKNNFKCYDCGSQTDRYIEFTTEVGLIKAFECVSCRQKRVKAQVDAGLRPESDLLQKNFPEYRNNS